jgi:DNA adenine methylase
MIKTINTPIRYFGGKGTMFKEIISYFPYKDSFNTYIEPFGGSYAVGLKNPNIPNIEVYNDLEKNVYSLYKVISDKKTFKLFKEKCDLFPYSEDFRTEFKDKLKEKELDIIDRAFYFFYVNRTSHNGIGGISQNLIVRRNMSKSVSDFLSSIDRMNELHQRISRVMILNTDGIELIKKYDRKNVFLYCDPPYHHSTRTSVRYKVDMSDEQQEQFVETVIGCKNAKILISGYDCSLYNKLTSNGFTKIDFTVNTVDGKRTPKVKIESLYKNY